MDGEEQWEYWWRNALGKGIGEGREIDEMAETLHATEELCNGWHRWWWAWADGIARLGGDGMAVGCLPMAGNGGGWN